MEKIFIYIDTKINQRYNFLSGKVRKRLELNPDTFDEYWKNFLLRWKDFLGLHIRMIIIANMFLLLRYRGIDYSQFFYPFLIFFISLAISTSISLHFGKQYKEQKPEQKFKKHEIVMILFSWLVAFAIGMTWYFLRIQ